MLAKGVGGQAEKGSFDTTNGLAQVRAQTPYSAEPVGPGRSPGLREMCSSEKGPAELNRVFVPEHIVLAFPGRCTKLNGLKQHKCTLFWRPEVLHESCRLKPTGWQGYTPPRGSRGESVSSPFPVPRGHLLAMARSPSFLSPPRASPQPRPLSPQLLLRLRPPAHFFQGPSWLCWAHPDSPE